MDLNETFPESMLPPASSAAAINFHGRCKIGLRVEAFHTLLATNPAEARLICVCDIYFC